MLQFHNLSLHARTQKHTRAHRLERYTPIIEKWAIPSDISGVIFIFLSICLNNFQIFYKLYTDDFYKHKTKLFKSKVELDHRFHSIHFFYIIVEGGNMQRFGHGCHVPLGHRQTNSNVRGSQPRDFSISTLLMSFQCSLLDLHPRDFSCFSWKLTLLMA